MPDKDWINLINSKVKSLQKEGEEEVDETIPVKSGDRVREFIESLPSVVLGNDVGAADKGAEEKAVVGKIGMVTNVNKLPPASKSTEATMEKRAVDWRDKKANLNLQTEKLEATAKVVFGEIPMPDKPDIPNVLVGMVTNDEGKIVDGAIVEIQDEKGNPSRVLKTNQLGQFKTTNPLANGKYLIITEKEGLQFDRVNVELTGKVVEPIKIKAII